MHTVLEMKDKKRVRQLPLCQGSDYTDWLLYLDVVQTACRGSIRTALLLITLTFKSFD